jgi:hypothetical protein
MSLVGVASDAAVVRSLARATRASTRRARPARSRSRRPCASAAPPAKPAASIKVGQANHAHSGHADYGQAYRTNAHHGQAYHTHYGHYYARAAKRALMPCSTSTYASARSAHSTSTDNGLQELLLATQRRAGLLVDSPSLALLPALRRARCATSRAACAAAHSQCASRAR